MIRPVIFLFMLTLIGVSGCKTTSPGPKLPFPSWLPQRATQMPPVEDQPYSPPRSSYSEMSRPSVENPMPPLPPAEPIPPAPSHDPRPTLAPPGLFPMD